MIVLDTHVLVWWVSQIQPLSATAVKVINDTLHQEGEIIISSISAREISMLMMKGRLILSMELDRWLDEVSQIEGVRFMPVDNEIAIKSTVLPDTFHKDPADRIIVATARKLAAPLVTADAKIRNYAHVHTVW